MSTKSAAVSAVLLHALITLHGCADDSTESPVDFYGTALCEHQFACSPAIRSSYDGRMDRCVGSKRRHLKELASNDGEMCERATLFWWACSAEASCLGAEAECRQLKDAYDRACPSKYPGS